MKVTLDTNILVQDFWMDGPHSRVFLNELNIIPATLHISQVVIDETVNKYREFLSEKVEELEKINLDVFRMLKREPSIPSINIEEATREYENFLIEKLKSVKVQILPYPKVEHKDVVKRILERKRPFKKGDSGYRDYLIWETIKQLELWGTEQIVFITNNIKDFGEAGYLSEEFTDKRTRNKNFKIVVTVTKFNDEFILPRLRKMEELKLQLNKGQAQNFNFKQWLDKEFLELLKDAELEEVLVGFPYGVGSVRVSEILMFDDYTINDVSEMESGEKFVHFSIKCQVDASVDIDWSDYINHKEVRDYYGDSEEEFSSSWGRTSERLLVNGFLILDRTNQEVNSVEITLIDGPHGSIEMGI
ncbi:DUF4935 domain-containing protein [Fibrisoma montanum]|uniref:DUF4935 domain-containing protein n=1 Tax=Fibrisoma montanum TaxID=2305895 RepID=A0A418LYV1_9BACT|nr:PIN domain-containing protein [Fibrisoma montanum]RIV18543.1 DUF4935 domain-containing protein [Fibrisoma montanum]